MSGTMTWVGLDVHTRSTHAAAIDVMTGELSRVRFGPGVQAPLEWLCSLPGPVKACYEAGPTGFGLYRALTAAGVAAQVIAPGKTPRGPSDRVKTDRKDAELLARQLLAGSLAAVVVPVVEVEAAREMTRAHDTCRQELMRARHRVSKMLLRHGLIYPKPKTWTAEHRRWLSQQRFQESPSDAVFADIRLATPTPSRRPGAATKPFPPAQPDAINHAHFDKSRDISAERSRALNPDARSRAQKHTHIRLEVLLDGAYEVVEKLG